MLKIRPIEWKHRKPGETLALFAFQDEMPALLGLGANANVQSLARQAKEDGFKARERQSLLVRPTKTDFGERLLLIGMGKRADFTLETLRRVTPVALRRAEELGLAAINIRLPQTVSSPVDITAEVQALVEGLHLGAYRFNTHRSSSPDSTEPPTTITLFYEGSVSPIAKGIERATIFAQAAIRTRDLVNEPPTLMNPERLAAEALKVRGKGLSVRVFGQRELQKLGMGALLCVGAGSQYDSKLVEIIYKPSSKSRRVVALVGKGITFDSGGLSLKPAQSMETMKTDMAGAASVLSIMSALPLLNLPIEVRGYMAIAENMPGGRATKPGDIVKTFTGKTIEVLNTDAEGRLVLSDALGYAVSKKPDVVIDIATLTGACSVALGSEISGVFSNTKELANALLAASQQSGEPMWELPLVKNYREDIKSKVADFQNIGSRRGEAGAIIGALFLQEFIGTTPWAHLDIAGPARANRDEAYCPTGGTGHPVRTLLHYLENL